MKICLFCKFFNDKANLERMLSKTVPFVDYVVLCDDSSTDGSREVAERYTKDILTLPNDFEAELEHKERLLKFALEKYPDIDWFLQLDSDEVLEKPEKLKELCRRMQFESIDGAYCHLINLFLSDQWYTVSDQFNSLWKLNLWKAKPDLQFDSSKGLHRPQNPINIQKPYYSSLQIIHRGFEKPELIARKYFTYQKLGQKGYSLDRLKPTRQMIFKPIDDNVIEPEPKPLTEQEWQKILQNIVIE